MNIHEFQAKQILSRFGAPVPKGQPASTAAEAAQAFYGSVFGWGKLTLPGGFQAWTLPGYGDYLERDNPGIRQRVAELGGTPGFEDVVASIQPIALRSSMFRPLQRDFGSGELYTLKVFTFARKSSLVMDAALEAGGALSA